MRRKLGIAVVVLAGLAGLSPAVVPPAVSQEGTTPPALVSLTATGTGVESYPAFAPSRRRFGVRTSADTGPITVTATTASPTDELTIAGLPTASGHGRVLRGLKPGEEITVRVVNTDGERIYSLVYLPPSFPEIPITTRQAGIAPGFLYLGFFVGTPFNIVMDNFGVPVYVNRRTQPPFDFKPQPGGRYTFLERSGAQTSTGRDIFEAVVLNERDAGGAPIPDPAAAGQHRQPRRPPPPRREPDPAGLRARRARRCRPGGLGHPGGRRRGPRGPALEQLG